MLARLYVNGPSGDFTRELEEGKTLMVGSGQACGLRLDDPAIS